MSYAKTSEVANCSKISRCRLKQPLMVLALLRQLQTKLKHNQLLMLQQQLRKKAQEELAAAQAADKEKATAIAAKKGN